MLRRLASFSLKSMLTAFILAYASTVFAVTFHTEIYKDFDKGDSLANIRRLHPNAAFEQINDAWVKSNQALIKMTGDDIAGDFFLIFNYSDSPAKPAMQDTQASTDIIEGRFINPAEEKMILNWVRWASPIGIPIEIFESRYGKPERCDVHDETLQPYCAWDSLGVLANLDAKKKTVLSTDYSYVLTAWKKDGTAPRASASQPHKAKPKASKPDLPKSDTSKPDTSKSKTDASKKMPMPATPANKSSSPLTNSANSKSSSPAGTTPNPSTKPAAPANTTKPDS